MNRTGSYARSMINTLLGKVGFELRRKTPQIAADTIVYDDPKEAMSRIHSGESAAFHCDIERSVIFNGFSFGPAGWHPFVEAIQEHLVTGREEYQGSVLEHYYQSWQPENALEALIGAGSGPKELMKYPAYLMHAPWLRMDLDERLAGIERIIEAENRSNGGAFIRAAEGHGFQGPVSYRKGVLEHKRLISLTRSIMRRGYDRSYGDIDVQILERNGCYRYRVVHGHHRVAALAALGYDSVPAVPRFIVSSDEVSHWPRVYRGPWSEQQARVYFDHHFDFDSKAWAQSRGLTRIFSRDG